MALPLARLLRLGLYLGIALFTALTAANAESGSGLGFGSESVLLSVYDVLESHGFPEGLLPRSVLGYTLDSNGRFTLTLHSPCSVDIPNVYSVEYSSSIAGRISFQLLYDLIGIKVKVGAMWWEIDSISVASSDLIFHVGPFQATYPISSFTQNPVCTNPITHLFSFLSPLE